MVFSIQDQWEDSDASKTVACSFCLEYVGDLMDWLLNMCYLLKVLSEGLQDGRGSLGMGWNEVGINSDKRLVQQNAI